jgi:triacylglycerol esterase/lipase EstA (alpha/beta hydrolase family)
MSRLISISKAEGSPAGDIVFVHGLGGDPRTTWHFDQAISWSAWINANRPDLNIWSLEYQASPSDWMGGSMPLSDRALNVLALLENRSLGHRPLVFVCHSMGGLLVKEMMRHGLAVTTKYQFIVDSTKAVIFFATPHTGATLADISKYLLLHFASKRIS